MIQYQTIEGKLLTRDEFKNYIFDTMKYISKNKDFNYPQFMYELRNKCGMTLEEFVEIVHEINLDEKLWEGIGKGAPGSIDR